MADDYDMDDSMLDLDDWLYVEDDYNAADELAEGQIAEPGYPGTNYEINMDSYEFELYAFWDDLEYADDGYWDFEMSKKSEGQPGQKRRRDAKTNIVPDKRRKTGINTLGKGDGDFEPLVFRSRDDRNERFWQAPPLLEHGKTFVFMADWKERFADSDNTVLDHEMPTAMKIAAEAQAEESPLLNRQLDRGLCMDEGGDIEDEWEDGADRHGTDDDGTPLNPEMIKRILREKLGADVLESLGEEALMETIRNMMSGEEEGDDATGELAHTLLGRFNAGGGDEAVSSWLSQQGVSLQDGAEDTSSVATEQGSNCRRNGREYVNNSTPDSAISVPEPRRASASTTRIPIHPPSPTLASKKRAAPNLEVKPGKKRKQVKSDDLSLSSELTSTEKQGRIGSTAEGLTMSQSTISEKANEALSRDEGAKTRKRKASPAASWDNRPALKKSRNKELEALGASSDAPSPAPPAKRTRAAKAKAKK